MSLQHKDNRRSLYEFKFPVTKVLVVHEDCILGNHYHKERDELFLLAGGEGTVEINGVFHEMIPMEEIEVKAGIPHSFHMKKDSVLLEFATKEYDKNDDYKA